MNGGAKIRCLNKNQGVDDSLTQQPANVRTMELSMDVYPYGLLVCWRYAMDI